MQKRVDASGVLATGNRVARKFARIVPRPPVCRCTRASCRGRVCTGARRIQPRAPVCTQALVPPRLRACRRARSLVSVGGLAFTEARTRARFAAALILQASALLYACAPRARLSVGARPTCQGRLSTGAPAHLVAAACLQVRARVLLWPHVFSQERGQERPPPTPPHRRFADGANVTQQPMRPRVYGAGARFAAAAFSTSACSSMRVRPAPHPGEGTCAPELLPVAACIQARAHVLLRPRVFSQERGQDRPPPTPGDGKCACDPAANVTQQPM